MAVKDEYLFDFLELGEEHAERELERALIARIEDFLRAMGGDGNVKDDPLAFDRASALEFGKGQLFEFQAFGFSNNFKKVSGRIIRIRRTFGTVRRSRSPVTI